MLLHLLLLFLTKRRRRDKTAVLSVHYTHSAVIYLSVCVSLETTDTHTGAAWKRSIPSERPLQSLLLLLHEIVRRAHDQDDEKNSSTLTQSYTALEFKFFVVFLPFFVKLWQADDVCRAVRFAATVVVVVGDPLLLLLLLNGYCCSH